MSHTRIHFWNQLRASLKNRLGSGAALLLAVACATAIGGEQEDVRTAFRDVVGGDSEPAPPAQPGPAPRHSNNHTSEALPTPAAASSGHHEPQHMAHCCPPPAYKRGPFGHLHRRWVTYTKPHLQASHWGYPEYFEERPFGTYVLQAEQMQIANGLRDQQVLYDYDFNDGSAELKPRGEYQLRKIIRRMEIVPCPIIVQTVDPNNPNPELDEARRQAVIAAMESAGVPAASELVVSDRPPLPGLQGVEGISVYGNMLGQTRDRGGGFDYTDDFGGGAPTAIFIGGGLGFGQPGQ